MKIKNNRIWCISISWANESCGENGANTIIYANEEAARHDFLQLIKSEKKECWSSAFDENGEIIDGYCVEETADYFEIWEDGCHSSNYTCFSLSSQEIRGCSYMPDDEWQALQGENQPNPNVFKEIYISRDGKTIDGKVKIVNNHGGIGFSVILGDNNLVGIKYWCYATAKRNIGEKL